MFRGLMLCFRYRYLTIRTFLLSSRLYCRFRNCTGSAANGRSRTFTAGWDFHPTPKNFFLLTFSIEQSFGKFNTFLSFTFWVSSILYRIPFIVS